MPDLEPITREETLLDGGDLTPITRKEMFIKRIYDKTQSVPEPITREEMFLKKAGEGSGGDVTIEQLNATENGTYSESGKAYSPVIVDVPTPPIPENAYLLNNLSGLPADIASFNDGTDLPMASLKVTVTPYQDLHGYDAPWVGGSGKNKLPMTVDGIKQINTSGVWNGNTYTFHDVTFKIETDDADNVLGIKVNGTSGGMAYFHIFDGNLTLSEGTKVLSGCVPNGSESTYYLQITAMPNSYTDVGNGISFTDEGNVRCNVAINMTDGTSLTNALFQPMIEYGSAKTTFAPYSNICPISGWTEAEVTRTGVNVWDEEWELGGLDINTGAVFSDPEKIRSKNFCACKPGTTYRKVCANPATYAWFYDIEKNFISFAISANTFTTPDNCYYFKLRIGDMQHKQTTYNHDISINYPSTDTEYYAYNGATYTIELDGTRYGGVVDATNGTMDDTLDHIAS
jgi:hypothetical protein